ncbi:MAG TPA: tripartite tricarboxylate transporter permease [Burkholderiales bacterium]|nr:tripartite tricarboxylate transporter permease [Burkholderiales bacterium]
MIAQAFVDLWHGFGVSFELNNLLWTIFGVVIGNLVGVLPGLGAFTAMALLLPLTFTMKPVAAILMLSGIFYGSMYGGAISAILMNLPIHASHAVTCLNGYPMTKKGRGGAALGICMISSFVAATFGIILMVFASPAIAELALKFGPAEMFGIMLFGLLAGGSMSSGHPLKGVAMTVFGLLLGVVGTDVNSGVIRYSFGITELTDGVSLIAVALGIWGLAEFLRSVNKVQLLSTGAKVGWKDTWPNKKELKESFWPMIRGTLVGSLFGCMPGTNQVTAAFLAYAVEEKVASHPEEFGHGAVAGVASPEAAQHSKTQVDFIPTMSLGIPGDPLMALILGALMIQGIAPGPQLITEHADIFWGLVASFWTGNLLLLIMNMPLVGLWIKLLEIPYRLLFPSAMFFIAIGVYAVNNSIFDLWETLAFGLLGGLFAVLEFPPAPILLGMVLGPLIEENFRRAMLLSRGDMLVLFQRPISAVFMVMCILLVVLQIFFWIRKLMRARARARAQGLAMQQT